MHQAKKKSFIQKNGLIAVWSMAGLIAVGYIGFLVSGAGQNNNGRYVVGKGSEATGGAPVAKEVAALRQHVKDLKSREEKLAQKLSKLEQSLGPITASLPDKPSDENKSSGYGIDDEPDAKAATVSHDVARPDVSISVLPLTDDDHIAALEETVPAPSYGISLASARSVESLERHWDFLRKTSGELLTGLQPRYIQQGTADLPLFNLVAGPFQQMSEAESRCHELSRQNIDCEKTIYDPADAAYQAAHKPAGR